MDAAIRDLSHSEQQLKNVTLRKGEAEKKYQAAILRQKLGMEEIARLTAWRERYKEKESIAEQLSALLLHLDAASAARSVFLPGSGSPLLPASTPAACLHWSVADRQVVYSTPQPPAGAWKKN